MLTSTTVFSGKAEKYATYRPDYPTSVLDFLRNELYLGPGLIAADIGSGTGIFTQQLLTAGYCVHAVEPNEDMRLKAEAALGGMAGFKSIEGCAESTGLDNESVDFISCAQAFHWFKPKEAKAEFKRILRGQCWVILLWNGRSLENANDFSKGLDSLLGGYKQESIYENSADERVYDEFFGRSQYSRVSFENPKSMDFETLCGMVLSRSYIPRETDPRRVDVIRELEDLFNKHQINGEVKLIYSTDVTFARMEK